MKVLIITGGNIDFDFAFSFLNNHKYDEVIAVDGGLAFADQAGIFMTHLVGDFDTIDPEILGKYKDRKDLVVHQFIPEKDYTDTDIALKLAIELIEKANASKSAQIHILGGTGSRLDHVLANLQLLKQALDHQISATIIDKNNWIQMIQGELYLDKATIFGNYISLIPATMELKDLTLKGFKYPLDHAKTGFGESLCVSNELIEDQGYIHIGEGMAWMILSRD